MAKPDRMSPSGAKVRFGGAVMLLIACLVGGLCIAALPYAAGLAGTRGTLTVDGYQYTHSSRGGTSTSSEGTFRSDDGRAVAREAVVKPEYALGERVAVTRAPWTYYVISPACFLGWLAGTCFALCCLLFGVPAIAFGASWNRRERPAAVSTQIRIAKGAFYAALASSVLAIVAAIAT